MNWFIIILFIISIILFLVSKYYLLKKKVEIENIEAYENENSLTTKDRLLKYHNITLQYLDVVKAKNLIVRDGEYLKGMNQANLSARGCISIDDLYNKYKEAFLNITNDEKDTIDLFILNLLDDIKNDEHYYKYVQKWLQKISIAKSKDWLEAGMPHTLDTTIVMDANWFIKPRSSTLIHEITHIHQRQYSTEFEDLYPSLGYYYNPVDIKGLEEIYPLNRNNPDGMSKYWLWHNGVGGSNDSTDSTDSNGSNGSTDNKGARGAEALVKGARDRILEIPYAKEGELATYWWIGAIFKTAIPSSLTDINMMALKLDKENNSDSNSNSNNNSNSNMGYIFYYLKQNPTPLNKFTEFINFFGDNPNNYHPNEMTAKFSEWFLEDKIKNKINNSNDNYEGYRIYKTYFENLINKYY